MIRMTTKTSWEVWDEVPDNDIDNIAHTKKWVDIDLIERMKFPKAKGIYQRAWNDALNMFTK